MKVTVKSFTSHSIMLAIGFCAAFLFFPPTDAVLYKHDVDSSYADKNGDLNIIVKDDTKRNGVKDKLSTYNLPIKPAVTSTRTKGTDSSEDR